MESPYFNSLLHHVSLEERYNKELAAAKEEFQQLAGPIFSADRNFDARINSFHNWYILERPLQHVGRTPLQYFLEFNRNSLRPEEWEGYQELERHLHSLFELRKGESEQAVVRDLLTGKRHKLEASHQTQHLDKGALFNTRLFSHQGQLYFSNYLILHPSAITKRIKEQARRLRKSKADVRPFLFQLLLFQGRWDHYKQMEVASIYRFEEQPRRHE